MSASAAAAVPDQKKLEQQIIDEARAYFKSINFDPENPLDVAFHRPTPSAFFINCPDPRADAKDGDTRHQADLAFAAIGVWLYVRVIFKDSQNKEHTWKSHTWGIGAGVFGATGIVVFSDLKKFLSAKCLNVAFITGAVGGCSMLFSTASTVWAPTIPVGTAWFAGGGFGGGSFVGNGAWQ